MGGFPSWENRKILSFSGHLVPCCRPQNDHNPRGTRKLHRDWVLVTGKLPWPARTQLSHIYGLKIPFYGEKIDYVVLSQLWVVETHSKLNLIPTFWEIRQFSRKTTPVQLWALPARQGWRFQECQARSHHRGEFVGCPKALSDPLSSLNPWNKMPLSRWAVVV